MGMEAYTAHGGLLFPAEFRWTLYLEVVWWDLRHAVLDTASGLRKWGNGM